MPVAPASLAFRTFSLMLQVPRSISATFPAGLARWASALQPRPTKTTSPEIVPSGAQSRVAVFG